jgi:hypothetical protein
MLDHHHLVVMAPTVIAMPTVVAMHLITMLDHDGFSICNRRRRKSDRAERGNNVSKLPHDIPPPLCGSKHHRAPDVPGERQKNPERLFSYD